MDEEKIWKSISWEQKDGPQASGAGGGEGGGACRISTIYRLRIVFTSDFSTATEER